MMALSRLICGVAASSLNRKPHLQFSHGQRQLFGVARALLKKSSVVMLCVLPHRMSPSAT